MVGLPCAPRLLLWLGALGSLMAGSLADESGETEAELYAELSKVVFGGVWSLLAPVSASLLSHLLE